MPGQGKRCRVRARGPAQRAGAGAGVATTPPAHPRVPGRGTVIIIAATEVRATVEEALVHGQQKENTLRPNGALNGLLRAPAPSHCKGNEKTVRWRTGACCGTAAPDSAPSSSRAAALGWGQLRSMVSCPIVSAPASPSRSSYRSPAVLKNENGYYSQL